MKKTNQVYLQDIYQAISKIKKYLKGISSFELFAEQDMVQDAIIRQMEIIGEAANKLEKDKNSLRDNSDFPFRQAIDMRNFLIHGYDQVNLETIWKTIKDDLPILNHKLTKLLKK
ncbi:DUF86 domain-containing protein [Patescibacteria group bacterium]|nr:DUF86 domain-containing protein [Patescibacteria group bacterium]